MNMSKRDYETAAEIIVGARAQLTEAGNDDGLVVIVNLALDLADAYERDNPRFDRHRFLVACGVET